MIRHSTQYGLFKCQKVVRRKTYWFHRSILSIGWQSKQTLTMKRISVLMQRLTLLEIGANNCHWQ